MNELEITFDGVSANFMLMAMYDEETSAADLPILADWKLIRNLADDEGAEPADILITNLRVNLPGDWRAFLHHYQIDLDNWLATQVANWLDAPGRLNEYEQSLKETAELARIAPYYEH